ncbi:helix-turn-helix domain-containing protein [Marinobacter sp.]|uniref:helix-turn-helix domain-containing protein n=1 Tax=Marinobacter sp. TaxID=50741 RepID=UPI003A8FBE3E
MSPRIEVVIGRNVRRLRALRGVSQAEVGRSSIISQKTMSNIERDGEAGSVRAESLDKIARYFGVHPALLLIDNLPDEALANGRVSDMMVQFARLDHAYQKRIQDLIADFTQLSVVPAANEPEPM